MGKPVISLQFISIGIFPSVKAIHMVTKFDDYVYKWLPVKTLPSIFSFYLRDSYFCIAL